jgi:dihydrofolate synthase/folylpolyglutamate synthase
MMLLRWSLQEMSKLSLEQWLTRIEAIHPEEVELGLARVSAVAQQMKLLPVVQPVVTVGGTNGKGSVVAVLEALLTEAGYSTGAFTSPHFLRFNERIRVAGVEVSDTEIIDAFAAIDKARGAVALTYFEFSTLAALVVFKARSPGILILEVGLGGRLDAVNIVDPSVAVITSIDLDHQGWLGESRGKISCEKAGILRESRPAVIAEPDPPPELLDTVERSGANPALFIGREFSVTSDQSEWWAELQAPGGESRCIERQPCGPLLPENIGAALQAALLLGVEFSDDCVAAVLPKVVPMGRRQVRQIRGQTYVLDVAHNPAAVRKLLEYIDVTPCNGKTIAVFSMMADKDIQAVIEAAADHFEAWFLAQQPGNKRAANASDIAALLNEAGQSMISISKNLRQAMRRAQSVAGEGDRLVVFGSFYTVAGVLPLLDREYDKYEAP